MEGKIGKAMILIMVLLAMLVPTGSLDHLNSSKEDNFRQVEPKWVYPNGTSDLRYEKFGPRLDKLLIKLYGSEDAEFISLATGDIDIIDWPLTSTWFEYLLMLNESIAMHGAGAGFDMFLLEINNNWSLPDGSPNPCRVPAFRHALAHLVDRDYIVASILGGFGIPIYTPVPASMGAFVNPDICPGGLLQDLTHPYDLNEARSLLLEGGFYYGGDGKLCWTVTNQPVVLKFYITSDDSSRLSFGDWYLYQLQLLNITVQAIIDTDKAVFLNVMENKDYHLYTGYRTTGTYPDFLYDFFHSDMYWHPGNSPNFNHFENSNYDYWAEKLKYARTMEDAVEAAYKAQEEFATPGAIGVIPLWSSASYKAYRRYYGHWGGEEAYWDMPWTGIVNENGLGLNSWWTFLNARPDNVTTGGTIRYGLRTSELTYCLNPLYASSSSYSDWQVLDKIYDTLLKLDPYMHDYIPWMVTNFTVGTWYNPEIGGEATMLTFNLDTPIYFHDGTPLTAWDVEFTLYELPHLLDNRGFPKPYWYDRVISIHNVTVLDPCTFIVYLKESSLWALGEIGTVPILPRRIWSTIATEGDPTYFAPDSNVTGSGPWKLKMYYSDLGYILLESFKPLDDQHGYFRWSPLHSSIRIDERTIFKLGETPTYTLYGTISFTNLLLENAAFTWWITLDGWSISSGTTTLTPGQQICVPISLGLTLGDHQLKVTHTPVLGRTCNYTRTWRMSINPAIQWWEDNNNDGLVDAGDDSWVIWSPDQIVFNYQWCQVGGLGGYLLFVPGLVFHAVQGGPFTFTAVPNFGTIPGIPPTIPPVQAMLIPCVPPPMGGMPLGTFTVIAPAQQVVPLMLTWVPKTQLPQKWWANVVITAPTGVGSVGVIWWAQFNTITFNLCQNMKMIHGLAVARFDFLLARLGDPYLEAEVVEMPQGWNFTTDPPLGIPFEAPRNVTLTIGASGNAAEGDRAVIILRAYENHTGVPVLFWQYHFIAVVDTTPPTIDAVSTTYNVTSGNLTISANVTDLTSGVDPWNVTLFYSINDGSWQNQTMEYVSGDTFNATKYALSIPVAQGSAVKFYIDTTDRIGNQAQTDIHTVIATPEVHNIAITNISPSKTVVAQDFAMNINVTVANQGDYTETFNVTLYADSGTPPNETGLVGYWNFDEGTGTIAHDSSGNNNDGTIYGATWTSGKYGNALQFDGIDDYVEVFDSASLDNVVDAVTISMWVKPNRISGWEQWLVSKGGGWYRAGFFTTLGIIAGTWRFGIGTGTSETDIDNGNLQAGQWYHLVATFDGTTMKQYINGQLQPNIATPASYSLVTDYPVRIGLSDGEWPNPFEGTIDEVKIYNRALSAEEVWAEYTRQAGFIIGTQTVTLESGASTTLTFTWDTTGFVKGNYTVSAYAWPVQGETDTTDNTFVDGWVYVAMSGDVNGDGVVDIFDCVTIALAYGSTPADPNWSPNADITNDQLVDIFDLVIVALHFGETNP